MKLSNKIYHGNTLEVLRNFPDKSIDMVMTSPPYWALRDYGVDGQLGLESNFNDYINKLCDIFDEVKRVLKKEGTCWVNLGDTYYTKSGSGFMGNKITGNRAQRTGLAKATKVREKGLLPMKCLVQIPFRFAIEMVNRGWILRNTIIWHKPNAMPTSVKDRFTVDFEYIFFFSKSRKYYFETQYEEFQSSKVAGNNPGRNKRCIWKIPTKPFPGHHFAVYPEKLCETPIKAGCPEGGVVLDPFFGAGTTGLVALKNNRQFVGIELNPDYIKIAEDRLREYL